MTDPIVRHGLETLIESLPRDAGVAWTIRLTSDRGYVNLRGDPGDVEFAAAAAKVLGQELPLAPNTVTPGKHRIYWLGPDEWLAVTPQARAADLLAELRKGLKDGHACVTDQSGGLLRLVLSGPDVEDLLAKCCTLDLHASVFGPNHCAQTGLAKAGVLLARADVTHGGGFELYVRRSFAGYVVRWLARAGREENIAFHSN